MENSRQHEGRQPPKSSRPKDNDQDNPRRSSEKDIRRTSAGKQPRNRTSSTETIPSYMYRYNEDDWQD